MNGHFISRSGTCHVLEGSDAELHGGRVATLRGFSQHPDEEPPGETVQICGWCLRAEKQARMIGQAALEAARGPRQDPGAAG